MDGRPSAADAPLLARTRPRTTGPELRGRGFESLPLRHDSRVHAERWPSGLRHAPGERVYPEGYRGFESHSLRHSVCRFRESPPETHYRREVLAVPRGFTRAARRIRTGDDRLRRSQAPKPSIFSVGDSGGSVSFSQLPNTPSASGGTMPSTVGAPCPFALSISTGVRPSTSKSLFLRISCDSQHYRPDPGKGVNRPCGGDTTCHFRVQVFLARRRSRSGLC